MGERREPEPFSWDDAAWYRTLLLQLRYGAGLHNRSALADIVAKTIRERTKLRSPRRDTGAAIDDRAAQLRQTGFCALGQRLDSDAVASVRTVLDAAPLADDYGQHPNTFTRATAPQTVNIGTIEPSEGLARCPHVLEAANHPEILAIVERFLGAPPTVQYYTAWWSFAGRPAAREAQLFHYDRNCFRFVKLFIYLTDVTPNTGPHVYVSGSSNVADWMRRLEEVKRNDPARAERFLAMVNAVRKNDDDVRDFFGPGRIETFTGTAGEAFLVDTSGIHKGLLPTAADRLLFQATYALLPALKDAPDPVLRDDLVDACLACHGDGADADYLRYVNRIAVTPAR